MLTIEQFINVLFFIITLSLSGSIIVYVLVIRKQDKIAKRIFVLQGLIILATSVKVIRDFAGLNLVQLWILENIYFLLLIYTHILYILYGYYFWVRKEMKVGYKYVYIIAGLFIFLLKAAGLFMCLKYGIESKWGYQNEIVTRIVNGFLGGNYILATLYILSFIKAESGNNRREKWRFSIFVGLPSLGIILYYFNIFYFPYDLSIISLDIMMVILIGIVYSYGLLDLVNLAEKRSYNSMKEGVMVVDSEGIIIHHNRGFDVGMQAIGPVRNHVSLLDYCDEIDDYIVGKNLVKEKYMAYKEGRETLEAVKVAVITDGKQICYHMGLSELKNGCVLIKAVRMEKYYAEVNKLEEKNRQLREINYELFAELSVQKRLIVAQEYNRISRELHDILGHSLTVVISNLEVVKELVLKNKEEALLRINQCISVTLSGISNLRKTIKGKKEDVLGVDELFRELERLVKESISLETDIDLSTKSIIKKITPQIYDVVYRSCQEGLTNAIRHGHAKKINIVVKLRENKGSILIIDNGEGCGKVVKGNGLSGMEERVKELKGYFACGSPEGEGFNIHISIPFDTIMW